jgi:hypothetical protein
MHSSFIRSFVLAIVTALALIITPRGLAQAITTSSLSGTVFDVAGKPASGANVAVTHEPTGSAYAATTRADGTFVFRGLRPGGPYTVKAELTGLARIEEKEVYLDIDRGAELALHLVNEEVVKLETFKVTSSAADSMFDLNQTGSGSYLNNKDIRNLPGGDRSINSLARLDPRISYNRDPFDRAISVNGTSNRYNSIQVDGVSASDPFGLNANNTAAERNVVPLDALEALAINTSPYFSRNAGFVGAQINAITKSGTNQYKGSVYYTYRGRSINGGMDMVGINIDGIKRPLTSFSEKTLGATLGGPIIPKKLFFYLSYEKVDEDRIAPSPTAMLDAATVAQITAAAKTLGFTTGSSQPPAGNLLTDRNLLAKVDWQINNAHRATFRYNKSESSRPTFPGFGSGISENNFSYDSAWYQQDISNTSYIGQLISKWNEKLNTEISVSRSKYHSEPVNNSKQPYVQIRNIPVAGSSNTAFVTFGTELSRHANILDVQTDALEAYGSYELSDKHTLQAGIQYDVADIYNLFVQNAYGSYDFNNLAQFLAVSATNNGTVNYRTYTYNQILAGVDPAATFGEANAGLFINDAWRVTPRLKIDLGARIDMALLPDAIPYNNVDTDAVTPGIQNFESIFGMRNNASYDGKKIIQPRVGFNWQLDTKRKTVIRGGLGLFYGRAPRVWISNSYSNTGMNFKTWSAGTNPTNGSATQAPIVSGNPDSQSTVGNTPAMQVAFMDPNFALPSKWKTNLAIEREVGFWNLKASAEIELTKTSEDIFYENVNIANTGAAADGRLLYWTNYLATSTTTKLVSTAFTNRTIKLSNTNQGRSSTVVLSLERPRQKDGWFWRASYVRTDAKEVMFGTSSVAASNWNNRVVFNANAQELHNAELTIKDKFLINVAKDFEFIKGNRTTFSLLYEGRSGYPFSFVYSTDINGDSQTQNDLIYVPRRSGDTLVRFATTTDQENFFKIVDRYGLTEGKVSSANQNLYPWVNQFDFGVKQEVKLPGWRHKLVLGMDVLNVGNMLNNKWGIIRGSNQFFTKKESIGSATYDGVNKQYVYSNISTALANGTYTTTVDGVPVVGSGFAPSLGRGEPAATRWSILLSARYEF